MFLNILTKIVWKFAFHFSFCMRFPAMLRLCLKSFKKVKTLQKILSYCKLNRFIIATFVLNAKVKSSGFYSILNLGYGHNSVALGISFHNERGFKDKKNVDSRKLQKIFQGFWTELVKKSFIKQSWIKYCRQILKIK